MTIKEFLEEIEKVFIKSNIECAKREALLLACHILSCEQIYIFIHLDEYIDEKILLASAALINERCKGRPLAYIIGSANFYGIELTVDERVLIPRPETECMVETALKELSLMKKESVDVLDLCTGSACIARAIEANEKRSNITASDISLKAYQIARHNCEGFDRIKVVRSDLFEKIEGQFDLIISNPPYVAERDKATLQNEVRDFEPECALFSGLDGLDTIRRILDKVSCYLKSGGVFLMEHSEDQASEILHIAKNNSDFFDVSIRRDLANKDRYLFLRKR